MRNTDNKKGYYNLDEIKAIPITQILYDFYGIESQPKGSHRAFCDIRGEKTPSCCLYLDTNSYCDFGDSNRGGNVINLVQQLSNCDFYEAVEMLADNYGISSEKHEKNALPTNSQYRQIGIQADMATKNFSFDIDKYGIQATKNFSDKYRMSVQELARTDSKIYHNMLKSVAVPHINMTRQSYYSNLYMSYLLCSQFDCDLTEPMKEEIQNNITELNSMEKIMVRAITDENLLKYTPQKYNIETDLNAILNGDLEFEIGNVSYVDLKVDSIKEKNNLAYKKVPYDKFISLRSNLDFPYAAYVNGLKREVNFITSAANSRKLDNLLNPKKEYKETQAKTVASKSSKYNTVVVNMFAGPGAGKTTCAWEIASALKKRGRVVEYVSEVAKEYVWDGNTEMLDGSIKSQRSLLEEQDRRVQRLMGKVEVIVTDSPILLNAIYLKEQNADFNSEVINRFKKQRNFNVFVERGKKYEKEGRIHNYEESLNIDQQIQDLLSDNQFYYKKYTYNQIKQCVENINNYVQKSNGRPLKVDFPKDSITAYCNKFYRQDRNIGKMKEAVR